MSIDKIKNAEPKNIETTFIVKLIRVLAASKGALSTIFNDLKPTFVLKMLKMMGEDDAISYIKKDKKRISSYITSRTPPLKFKKFMSMEKPCVDLLGYWFVSNSIKQKLLSSSHLSFGDLENNDDNEQRNTLINLTEKLLDQDDLFRSYIALGCLLANSNVQHQFSDQDIDGYLSFSMDISREIIADYLAKIKNVQEYTSAFRVMILEHEKMCESLAEKYEDAAEKLRNGIIPQDDVAAETKQLADSLEKLKTLCREKMMNQEDYVLSEGETLDTFEDIKIILDNIENSKQRKVRADVEAAKNILKKAKSISISSEENKDRPFAVFREQIDILENQVKSDHSCVEKLLSGNHVIAKLLRYIENKDKKTSHEEIGTLLLELPEFCGPEESNAIIGNLMVGKIVFDEAYTSEENQTTSAPHIAGERIKSTIIRRRAVQNQSESVSDKESIEKKEDPENIKHYDEVELSVEWNAEQHVTSEKTISIIPAEEKEELENACIDESDSVEVNLESKTEKQVVSKSIGSITPAHIYALQVSTSLDQHSLENLLWALIYEDDLPGAYWLSRAIEFKYGACIVSPWILKAAQGARWIGSDSVAYVDNLLEIAKTHRPEHKKIESIIGLAAAIRPSLIQPGCGLIDWLQKPEKYSPALIKMVESVKEFSKYGRAIMPEEVKGVVGSQNLNARIMEVAESANRWLKAAHNQKAKFRMATEVWQQLSGPKGDIYQFLQPVINNDKGSAQDVKANLNNWQKLDYVELKIDEITKKNSKLRSKTIVGPPRKHIIRNIEEACDLAYNWCQLTDREQEYVKKGNKLSEQIEILQKNVRECVPALYELFSDLTQNSEPAPVAAAFSCLARSLNQVLKDININTEGNEFINRSGRQWPWLTLNANSLEEAIGRRLIMIPEYTSAFGAELKKEQQEEFIRVFCDSITVNHSLEDIFRIWIRKYDYRYIELLKPAFDGQKGSELQVVCNNAINESKHKLKEALAVTGSDIEQALVDGVITDEAHSEYNDQIQAIELSSDLNYSGKNDILNGIQDKINNQTEQRLNELNQDWGHLRSKMEESSEVTQKKEQVEEFLRDALNRKDTRVVEESLAHLREVFDKGINFEDSLFRTKNGTDELNEYVKTAPKIREWLESAKGLHVAEENIERGVTRAGIIYGDLAKPRKEESINALEVWRKLKQKSPNAMNLEEDIASISRFMAFNMEFKDGKTVQVQDKGKDWVYCTANMSAGDLAKPIPQFGSLTRNKYDIICLWERPGADTIAARLRELRLDVGTAIVFYLGRLSDLQRRDLVKISREKTVSAVLLDEILLVYLTKSRDASSRLPVFLRCSLPYTVLNPYMPFQAGDVPPEMFFGRMEMIRELQKMGGSCIVYGGRQLGKSALLRRVQSEFHNPVREQYAYVLDIKLLGDPKAIQHTSLIWGRIRDSLKAMGLLSKNITTERADEIRKYINEIMRQDNKRKLILLFDEADNFLEADARENFREVEALRIIMLESGYRLKVVFAGLQNVQRFQGIPNQPLAHFGTNICVGPLEPDAARRLVIEPIEAIGYRFNDERTTVLRILSYTNYHPGLIQLFCQELVRRLESTTGSMSPPFSIRQEDVEAVYRLDEVRNRIKERFDWTLALNSRYQAIAWLMVLDQIEKRDSYAMSYPPGTILKIARDWWQEGFGDLGLDELRGLLNEMCGLGVLVRNRDGHYRLRSPNLARLLGTDEDIMNNLGELVHKNAPLPFNADNYHVPLDNSAHSYSPLTYFQERSLNKQHSGTSLIFSSEAMGMTYLKSALKKFVSLDTDNTSGLFSEMPAEILCADTMSGWLEKHMESNKKHENLVVYKRIYETDNKDIASCVNQALQFCNRHQSRKRWIRIYFVFDHLSTWKWVALPEHIRKEIEDKADASIVTRKWNLEGLKQRLAQHEKMYHENILAQTLAVTGGWPLLLDILFERCRKHDDVRQFLPQMESELKDSTSKLRKDFLAALGILDNTVARSLLIGVKDLEDEAPVPTDMLIPSYIGNELNADDCRNGIEYLSRMSCLDIQSDAVCLDPIVKAVLS